MAGGDETERVRRYYERTADRYDAYVGYLERLMLGESRRWVCTRARGEVLEIGVGTGRNLAFYPEDVHLTGIDLTPEMLARAGQRAGELGRDVRLEPGDAQALGFPDARFDSVVATLALSSIPDDRRAMAEAARVLRPGGRLLVLDLVRSPFLPARVIQRGLDPLFVRWFGDHLLRDPVDYLGSAGLAIERLERSAWGVVERLVAVQQGAGDGAA